MQGENKSTIEKKEFTLPSIDTLANKEKPVIQNMSNVDKNQIL
jgi:hypothetical protein